VSIQGFDDAIGIAFELSDPSRKSVAKSVFMYLAYCGTTFFLALVSVGGLDDAILVVDNGYSLEVLVVLYAIGCFLHFRNESFIFKIIIFQRY
jgi:hypothetical protein